MLVKTDLGVITATVFGLPNKKPDCIQKLLTLPLPPTGACTHSRSRNCDQFHRPWLYAESVDEGLTRSSAPYVSIRKNRITAILALGGGSLRDSDGPRGGRKKSTTWFVSTAENKRFLNSKPLFEGGPAHPEDYLDIVEHFSESAGWLAGLKLVLQLNKNPVRGNKTPR